eukprot:m.37213 g.37213  ORF g.37213 m.37213 type:complete len:810 (+) comp9276_c0_seq2:247-2676(+)
MEVIDVDEVTSGGTKDTSYVIIDSESDDDIVEVVASEKKTTIPQEKRATKQSGTKTGNRAVQPKARNKRPCTICNDSHRPRAMYTLGCGHNFGKACLSKISNQKVHGKSGLLTVPRCPTCNVDFGILDLNILCPAELCVAIARNRISGHLAKQRTPSIKCKCKRAIPRPKRDQRGFLKKGLEADFHVMTCATCNHNAVCAHCGEFQPLDLPFAEIGGHGCAETLIDRFAVLQMKINSLHSEMHGAKTKKSRKSSAKPKGQQTVWSKGTGFGGSNSRETSAVRLKASAREKKQDTELSEIMNELANLCQYLTLERFPSRKSSIFNGTHGLLCVQFLLFDSKIQDLLAALLRNDSLMDITSNRSALYGSVLKCLEVSSLIPMAAMLMGPKTGFQEALRDQSDLGSKRLASDANLDEDDFSSILDIMKGLDAQCKVFIKQVTRTTGDDGLQSADPTGLASKTRQVYQELSKKVETLDQRLRASDVVDLDEQSLRTASSEAISVTPETNLDKEKTEYEKSMKPLLFKMAKISYERHAFKNEILISAFKQAKPERMRRIARELSSLASSLPLNFNSSIFVRVDDARPDVLKAVIVGPEGTPYQNGCFCFDIFLPIEYPELPPRIVLRTTGTGTVRFNPNLYRNGKVCLSLLGTWQGPGWDVKNSTLLQVLLSIQSLILVDDPYFNEPGYETQPGAGDACKMYNHTLRFHTIQNAMLDNLNHPDPDLLPIIRSHFRCKKESILNACRYVQIFVLTIYEHFPSNDRAWSADAKHGKAKGRPALHELQYKTRQDISNVTAKLETVLQSLHVESVTID